jgi:O-antigen/teichoic acid export membrane protein
MGDADREEYFNRMYNAIVKVLISICCVVLSLNPLFFNFLFQRDYFAAFYQAPILISAVVFASIANFYGSVFVGFKDTRKIGLTTTLAALVNVAAHLSLIQSVGLYAASLSTLASNLFLALLRFAFVSKRVKLKLRAGTKLYFLIYCFFFATAYVNVFYVTAGACFLSASLFLLSNKNYFLKALRLLKRRRERQN